MFKDYRNCAVGNVHVQIWQLRDNGSIEANTYNINTRNLANIVSNNPLMNRFHVTQTPDETVVVVGLLIRHDIEDSWVFYRWSLTWKDMETDSRALL